MAWSLIYPPEKTAESIPERIYTDYFSLRGIPFSITPDPEFLFFSDTHLGVLEKLQYGINGRMGFMLLTGEVGTGKTTLCRTLLDKLEECARTVYVINPSLSGVELLACILEDLGLDCDSGATKKTMVNQLNRFLINNAGACPVVIIIDDAQTMPLETLEDLRLLSNLETDKNKLLQILLVGQPELAALLNRPEMRQLKQRVAIHCRLDLLNRDEVGAYIDRRLAVAGNQGQVRFSPKAIRRVYGISRGVPRRINILCDLALTAAYAADSRLVDACHVSATRDELMDGGGFWRNALRRISMRGGTRPRPKGLFATGLLLLLMILGYQAYRHKYDAPKDLPKCLTSTSDGTPSMAQTIPARHLSTTAKPMTGTCALPRGGSF